KPGPQPHHASYGAGTFALGKQKATAGLLDKGAGDKKESPKTKEEEEMEKRMQRFLERQQGQSGKSAGPKKQSAEEWWAQASSIERRWWLQAYYAEFSGDMTVKPDKRRCQQCGGKGKLEFLSTGGGAPPDTGARSGSGSTSTSNDAGVSSVECPLCHGLCLERVVTYR
ncbi:MAG TPA: hypothetical protein VKE69_04750, partial [Planctomycetota bacterium]|nr:hypothetical protein [Planctomycetota bacterium]